MNDMTINPAISIVDFLRTINLCKGEVYFRTKEGDHLNLKSELSQYLFLSLAASDDQTILQEGEICCSDTADHELLQKYIL